MSIEKKHYVDINLQGNKLVNPTLGTADLSKSGSFGFDAGRIKYYDGTATQDVANLNDLANLADDIAADITAGFISALKFQGAYDVALNSPELEAPAADAVKAGYVYVASSDGEFFTELVKTGDTLIAKVDNPSTLADWIIVQSNIDFATTTTSGIVRMADAADITSGTSGAVAVTPAQLKTETDARIADVNAEETRALAAEAALSTDITNLQTYVDTTVDTAITTLTTDLAAETAARIADVNAEETRALAAEAALQTAIDAVEAVATTTATETQLGVVELATEAEALAGTSTAAIAIIPATMQAKIDTQSTTLVIASNAWTLSGGVYTHTLTHGLECSNPVIETRLSSGDVVSFKETYVTDNSTMITSNVALTEDVIVSFTKIAGTGNIVGNPSNSPVNLSDYVATADLATAIATQTANKAEKVLSINDETASYTLVLTDAANAVDMNVASANTVTVPTNASVAFPIGTQIIVIQSGAGQTSFVAAGGVTILSEASKVKIGAQYGMVTLIKKGTNTWYLAGNLTA